MFRLGHRIGLALAVWLTLLAPAPVRAAEPAADSSRMVLVLLRLPPEHFRPNGDYAGGYGDGTGRRARERTADRLARTYGLTRVDSWPMPVLGLDCFVMSVADGQSPAEMADRLSKDPSVAWSQPMGVFRTRESAPDHSDPLFRAQPVAREWRLADLHQIATGRRVKVAVIDSRVEKSHPDLAGQVEVSQDFVPQRPGGAERHGTGVAGIIAAVADNDVGIVGVAPRARLMALRACWQTSAAPQAETVCDTLSLAKALDFAIARGAQVINLSLSGPADPLLGRLIDIAVARGAAVVGAFDPELPGGGFPASHAGVVAVAEETRAEASPTIYYAPGRDIPTTQPGGRWFLVNGSSYAAAHVSGLFALLRERRPARGGLVLAASKQGGGKIDACATLLQTALPCACACAHAAN